MSLNLSKLAAVFGRPVHTAVGFIVPDLSEDQRVTLDEYASHSKPFMVGDVLLKQTTEQTCGAMALLASLVLTYPGLRKSIEEDPESVEFLEAEIFADLRSGAVGGMTWPAAYGTPPWTLAREMSDGVVKYRHLAVDDASESGYNALQWAYHATTQGHCVPLYTGGSLGVRGTRPGFRRRLTAAVPRHVVLAIPGDDVTDDGLPQFNIFDPASGHVHAVPFPALMKRNRPLKALGNWSHVVWAVLPEPAA